jgi:hypothetical protein
LSSTLMLWFPDFVKPFEVHTDASGFAIGGILMQKWHPIAFESKQLTMAYRYWYHKSGRWSLMFIQMHPY